jgi:hypothetical protein
MNIYEGMYINNDDSNNEFHDFKMIFMIVIGSSSDKGEEGKGSYVVTCIYIHTYIHTYVHT